MSTIKRGVGNSEKLKFLALKKPKKNKKMLQGFLKKEKGKEK